MRQSLCASVPYFCNQVDDMEQAPNAPLLATKLTNEKLELLGRSIAVQRVVLCKKQHLDALH
jgi:hypothetical protein